MTMDMDLDGGGCNNREATGENSPGCSGYSSMVHSKKVIKHALRQQAKRRRKNTTIAAGNSRTLPRIIVKPLPPPPPDDPPVTNVPHTPIAEEPAATMREVLASLPGFSLKSGRRRSTKRLSAAAQLEAGLVDLESPTSILANTSLRVLLNRHTFQGLPPLYQRKLAQLLPAVDRQDAATSGLNNEFFARACLEWRKRLTEGEFTPENQQRLKMEAERDKNKLDPWKLKHFEPIWGEKREPKLRSGLHCVAEPRSAGAVTRSCLRLRLESALIHGTTESNSCPSTTVREERVEVENHSPKPHVNITEDTILASRVTQDNGVTQESEDCTVPDSVADETPEQVPIDEKTDIANSENVVKDNSIAEEVETILESKSPDSCRLKSPKEITELPIDDEKNVVNLDIQETAKNEESVVVVPKTEEVEPNTPKQLTTEEDVRITKVEQNSPAESVVSQQDTQDITVSKSIVEEPAITEEVEVAESCSTTEPTAPTTAVAEESQIPEEMEIDSETLRRIHELEVRGEMRAAYEEISGCPEEIIYPILESMEIGTSSGGETDTSVLTGQVTVAPVQRELATGNEEDAFIDANNYVLESREIRSEMLDCSWTVDPTVNNNSVSRTHEDLQVPWPLVAAALDGSVAANITVTTQDDCAESLAPTEMIERVDVIPQISVNPKSSVAEAVNCVQIPVDQTSSYRSDSLMVGTPVTTCLLNRSANSLQPSSESPPIIAFSQLQSIRFVQTSFHPGQTNTETLTDSNTVPLQIQSQSAPSPQLDAIGPQDEIGQIVSTTPNIVGRTTVQTNNVILRGQIPNAPTCVSSPNQARNQNPVSMVQQPTPIAAQPRQIVATVQQQYPPGVTVSSRTARSTGQSGQRGSRGGNKEQGSGRSRSSTKEPPGAVNLERSYQICQAVIQSSPNRDQLKAHLKPPPSLLARADGVFTTSKPGGRSLTAVKTAKSQQTVQHVKQTQNKAQAVMLRHVFATARQAIPTEVTDNGSVAQISTNGGTNGLGQYILVQRTGVGDSAPRASSAPPLPPQIPGMGMGLQLVRGRPASAGEGSHQAVTLKARGASDGRGGGGAEPGAPGVIMGGDPPPPCECNMRGAMVICRQCGAFCHDDCIGPQRICATCLIR